MGPLASHHHAGTTLHCLGPESQERKLLVPPTIPWWPMVNGCQAGNRARPGCVAVKASKQASKHVKQAKHQPDANNE